MNIVKRTYVDIQKVKQKIYGNEKTMHGIRVDVSQKLIHLMQQSRLSLKRTGKFPFQG